MALKLGLIEISDFKVSNVFTACSPYDFAYH